LRELEKHPVVIRQTEEEVHTKGFSNAGVAIGIDSKNAKVVQKYLAIANLLELILPSSQ